MHKYLILPRIPKWKVPSARIRVRSHCDPQIGEWQVLNLIVEILTCLQDFNTDTSTRFPSGPFINIDLEKCGASRTYLQVCSSKGQAATQ